MKTDMMEWHKKGCNWIAEIAIGVAAFILYLLYKD